MAVIKCKMCGGDLTLTEGKTVAECEYCGTLQTVPVADDEKKLTLFARANRLRAACEFDKASGIYESIVADFPEEAEAYWGLVLCKFGIEYVDDPATAKKIPTCHRSSFDSIMDDSDFEQALENADSVARKVYRDEAKVIEEIRKGIIAVSSNEEPYDIFICYKETAEDGQRTLDSVLAQDLYDTLTDKGYRVFFARITLEDKLGQEYEPYIFAALNSAKIMLAIGTDYEYYNAVWVKNEWSRYLKLMAKDKEKHLIPCYKGIDAYDMPKEFNKLQAQDLGKVGATQDLLRGIAKIIPKQLKQESKSFQNNGQPDNQTKAYLERAKMAMEDGEWEKADEFYEMAMNLNAHCAEAYIGKLLIQYQVCSLEKLAEKRLSDTLSISNDSEKMKKEVVEQILNSCVEKYRVPGYFERQMMVPYVAQCKVLNIGNGSIRRKQRQDEEQWWNEEKLLKRALQFADADLVEKIRKTQQTVLLEMDRRIESAESSQAMQAEETIQRLHTRLQQIKEKAEAEREQDYQRVSRLPQTAGTLEIDEAIRLLRKMAGYRASGQMLVEMESIKKRQSGIKQQREKLTREKARILSEIDNLGLIGNPFRKKELKMKLEQIDKQLDALI